MAGRPCRLASHHAVNGGKRDGSELLAGPGPAEMRGRRSLRLVFPETWVVTR
jgi:hypothetical protein